MHKTNIFDQKNNANFFYCRPTYPIFFQTLQETNNIFFWPYHQQLAGHIPYQMYLRHQVHLYIPRYIPSNFLIFQASFSKGYLSKMAKENSNNSYSFFPSLVMFHSLESFSQISLSANLHHLDSTASTYCITGIFYWHLIFVIFLLPMIAQNNILQIHIHHFIWLSLSI